VSIDASFALLAPTFFLAASVLAWRQPGRNPRRVLAGARLASMAALGVAGACWVAFIVGGASSATVWQLPFAAGAGVGARLDPLSLTMLTLIAALGAAVLQFSRRYLDGDLRHGTFFGQLLATLGWVALLVVANNLLQLVVAWVLTSLSLHRLLVFYGDRPGALRAARKKFAVARIGEACLAFAAVLLFQATGTADFSQLTAALPEALADSGRASFVHAAAGLIVASAALKSAQFPTHGWLIDLMETPTPVSALLHAGILNGGTFLVVRLAPVVSVSPTALHALVAVGAFTAAFSSVVMVTRPHVKASLAYSSAAHMGFMLFMCGAGAWTVAILHLVAHSFYKAHAFLASASAAEVAVGLRAKDPARRPAVRSPVVRVLVAAMLSAATFGVVAWVGKDFVPHGPVELALGGVLVLALTQLFASALEGPVATTTAARVAWSALLTSASFLTLEAIGLRFFGPMLPSSQQSDSSGIVWAAVALFATISLLQAARVFDRRTPFWTAAYVHLKNGLYVSAALHRLLRTNRPQRHEARLRSVARTLLASGPQRGAS
jgi:NAD(P)H-quinone oxidoreductase subunit 5